MAAEKSGEAYICKTCGQMGEREHLCNPATGSTACKFCGKTVEEARHMCNDKLQRTEYYCTQCGRVGVDAQCLCKPEKIS